jgi:hypothetical protein
MSKKRKTTIVSMPLSEIQKMRFPTETDKPNPFLDGMAQPQQGETDRGSQETSTPAGDNTPSQNVQGTDSHDE